VGAPVAQLAVNRLTIVPFTAHSLLPIGVAREEWQIAEMNRLLSFGVIVDYNTVALTTLFL
jgi:hypothetical protein